MRNFWLMAKHEYFKMVGKRSFLLGTLAVPLIMALIMTVGIITSIRGQDKRPVGYVDKVGIMAPGLLPPVEDESDRIEFRPFRDETAADAALAHGDIQAYYLLPADYLYNRAVTLTYWDDDPSSTVTNAFNDLVRINLAANLSPEIQTRLVDGNYLVVRALESNREIDSKNPMAFILPFVAAFLFIFIVMGSASYLLQVVTDEKENRTVEIMVTSLTPGQMIGGKALGLMAVSLTQVFIWIIVAIIGLTIGAQYIVELQNVKLPWSFLFVTLLYFLPAYALISGLMTAVGGAVTDLRQGQQIVGILNLFFIIPFFFIALIFAQPDSPVLVALTLFPTTAFISIIMRYAVSIVPFWQMALSWLLLTGTAVLSVWASAKIFRAGMLSYGQLMNLHTLWQAIRS